MSLESMGVIVWASLTEQIEKVESTKSSFFFIFELKNDSSCFQTFVESQFGLWSDVEH